MNLPSSKTDRLTPAQLDAALCSAAGAEVARLAARRPLVVTGPLTRACRATHGDAMCLLEHGHHGRHVGRLSAAAVADWDDTP